MKLFRRSTTAALALAAALSGIVFPATHNAAHAAPSGHDGLSEATAAASCWEIKQNNPSAKDGTYWLQTSTMEAPEQFFCDQSSDGGGWVLIGRGREGWETWSQGQGDQSKLRSRERTPNSFGVVQASHETVNGLLDGAPVSSLAEGMRVVRAYNARGNSWQVADLQFPKMTDFIWPFKSAHPVTVHYRGELRRPSGIVWSGFGTNTAWGYMNLTASSHNDYTMGFGYGPAASSGNANKTKTSYFYRAGSMVLPYAEVYIRPHATSSRGFSTISDGGRSAQTQKATVSEYATPTSWGVTGNLNGSVAEGSIQVQAFEQVGDTMYVGGNFTGVKRGSAGAETRSEGLAAFNATTGEWNGQTFHFNNQVKDLIELPGGKLLAVGDFTAVNGIPRSGTVLIDATTGSIDRSWDLNITNSLRGGRVSVKAAKVTDSHIYLAGVFTHLNGNGVSTRVYARNAARLSLDGKPDRSWNPEFNASVLALDVDEAGGYAYAGGHFTRSQNRTAEYAVRVSTKAGASLDTSWTFQASYFNGKYQQGIAVADGRVYIGGSQHSLFGYNTANMRRTSGSITMQNGGDVQAVTHSNTGVIYASCHCSDYTFQDAYEYYNLGTAWTRADEIQWVGGWDAATGRQLGWTPYRLASQRDTGAWALETDNSGALWVGGDFTRSYTSIGSAQWSGGFVRYPARASAPAAPANLHSTSGNSSNVALRWSPVAGAASYEILRDDRTIATSDHTNATVPLGGQNRFFVRAVGADGLRGATTPVYAVNNSGKPVVPDTTTELLTEDATWSYRWTTQATPEAWAQASFDASGWESGAAPIGYGADGLGTTLRVPAPKDRPITTYARTAFRVSNLGAIGGVNVSVVADDGAIAYVNGKEIGRERMNSGTVTSSTYAHAPIATATARTARATFFVPASQLVEGENTLAVETHLNYRSSPSMTISATVVSVDPANVPVIPEPEPQPQPQPGEPDQPAPEPNEGTLGVHDVSGVNFGPALYSGERWSYWFSQHTPDAAWASNADLSSWAVGRGPIGWGDSGAATTLSAQGARPVTAYFARDLNLGTLSDGFELTLQVRVDDGAIIYVNGHEVERVRMPEGNVTASTRATSSISLGAAKRDLVSVTVPRSVLRDGINRIAVEEHANYASAPSLSFDLTADLKR